jgi:hypothetical protein
MRLAPALLLTLLTACAGEDLSSQESLTRSPYVCSDIEVHVIGVNDSNDAGTTTGSGSDSSGGGDGDSTVILSRPGHHILVLSSKYATTWHVEVKGEAKLDGVYAVGHEPSKVLTNVKTKINIESGMTGGAEAYGYQYPSKDVTALLKLTSIRVARHATSFHGCKSASRWEIAENMLTTSDCPDLQYTQFDAVLDCDGDNTCGSDEDGDGDTGDGWSDGSLY